MIYVFVVQIKNIRSVAEQENKKIKEIEQKAMEEVTKIEPSKFHFDINEVPRIVLQNKEKDER